LFRRWLIVDALMFAIVFSFAAQICMSSVASKQNFAGVVYGADGPVAGAFVYASGAEGQGYGYTTTDGSGHYSLSKGLRTGNYTVTVWAVGYMMGNTDNVQVTAGQPTTGINFDLQLSGAVSGTVTDAVSSNPLSGIMIVAYTGGGGFGWQAMTDSNGKYYIATNLATGSYNITELFPEGHIALSSVQAVTAGAEVKNVNLALPRSGIISGKITTPEGTPLNNVTIMASSAGGLGYTTTNATGDYRMSNGLGTDTYFVMAIASGGGLGGMNSTPSVSVTAGLETSGVDMELSVTPPSPSGIITGQVTDVSTGKPIGGASVTATGSLGGSGTASTDSNGDYTISSGLGTTGSYNVTASAPGYQDQLKTGVSVTIGAVTSGVDFQLSISSAQSGTITGTVAGAPGAVPEFQYPIAVALSLALVVAAAGRLFQRTKRSQNARSLK
jgi:hypothetical protein